MRNIEFKGLTKNEPNIWVYGYLLPDNNIYQTRDEEKGGKGMFSIIPESVGQYTGRRDKHNVKIYENDIVKDFERGYCFKVKCENGAFLLDDEDISDVKDYLKDLPFYQDEITDEILELVFGDKDIDDKFYYKLREIEDFTKIIIADKYYKYFRLDFIKEFLGE